MPIEEFNLLKLLCFVLATLSGRQISKTDIEICEEKIIEIISKFGSLYDDEMFRYNVHALLHLPNVVRKFGPLIVNSAYQVENIMGQVAKKVSTSTKVPEQTLKKSVIEISIATSNVKNFNARSRAGIGYL